MFNIFLTWFLLLGSFIGMIVSGAGVVIIGVNLCKAFDDIVMFRFSYELNKHAVRIFKVFICLLTLVIMVAVLSLGFTFFGSMVEHVEGMRG